MPQLNKGGKFVYGFSEISDEYTVQIPDQALCEYGVTKDNKIIIITGSKTTGGFCVTNKSLLSHSKLKHILDDCISLSNYSIDSGEFIRYKGRGYSWLPISSAGVVRLTKDAMKYLNLVIGDKLMCIRSSDIAFMMGVKGPLIERANAYKGEIKLY